MSDNFNHTPVNSQTGPSIPANHPKPWDIFLEDMEPYETMADCVPPFPANHRPLFPGERVRRGDRIFRPGMEHWEEVFPAYLGKTVQEPDEIDSPQYCRAIHPRSRYLYVDSFPDRGRADATGSPTDPFDSLESAQRALDKIAQECGEGPFGMIWEVRGDLLKTYDLPEPPEDDDEAPWGQRSRRQANAAGETRRAPASTAGMVPVPPSGPLTGFPFGIPSGSTTSLCSSWIPRPRGSNGSAARRRPARFQ